MKVKSGEYVAKYVEPVDEDMIQPAGVDLRAGQVFEFKENATFKLLKAAKTYLSDTKRCALESSLTNPGAAGT